LHVELPANVSSDDCTYTDCFRKAVGLKNMYMHMHDNELNDLYSSPMVWVIKSRRMRWVGHVACMVESKYLYSVLVGEPEGKRLLGIPRYRW